jgi:hypothetical protein
MSEWIRYLKQPLKEKYLFRFLSKEHLDKFLETGSLWFSRADQFGDKMECVRIADLRKERPDIQKLKDLQKKYLISCWHLANKEMLAFWDRFTNDIENRKNFAIRFKTEDLISEVEDSFFRNTFYYLTSFTHGHVRYKNLVDLKLLDEKKIKRPAFRKEFAFRFEHEYRFVIKSEHSLESIGRNYHLRPAIKLNFDILINPYLEKKVYLLYKKEIEASPFAKKLKHSDLEKWLKPELC